MPTVSIHQAKTQLSRLIAKAEAGEEIVIARGKDPVVKLTPLAPRKKRRPPAGLLKGKVELPDAFFFDPLSEEELRLWEGNDETSPR